MAELADYMPPLNISTAELKRWGDLWLGASYQLDNDRCGIMAAMTQLSFFKYLETSFPTNKQTIDNRKLRGGYYTPLELAHYLVKWGFRDDTTRILEPSCGDGNFILAILQHLQDSAQLRNSLSTTIVGVELKADELSKARDRAEQFGQNGAEIEWVCQDFFEAYHYLQQNEKFNLIVGNPPFIRFQYFDDDSRNQAFGYLRQAGYKPTKLANAWVAFVQLSIELLQEGGRLAMVVPAELLQVKYTHELRDRLATQFEHIMLVGFKRLAFPEIQQEVLLLLAEGKREGNCLTSDIHTIEFLDGDELLNSGNLDEAVAHVPAKHSRVGMKWTSLFLDETAFAALDEAESAAGLIPLGKLAEVDVGIVTGRNSFFILTETQKDKFQDSDDIEIDIAKVENLLRRDCVYEALDYVDNIVLKNYLGLDNFMMRKIRRAWEQLRDRRVERK